MGTINRRRCKGLRRQTHTQTTKTCHAFQLSCHLPSNSKWICDLSIDSFSPRLWIKCFNYWCTDVKCPLECCMWCRPLSPGRAASPHPACNPTETPLLLLLLLLPPTPPLLRQTPSCSSQPTSVAAMNGAEARRRRFANRCQQNGLEQHKLSLFFFSFTLLYLRPLPVALAPIFPSKVSANMSRKWSQHEACLVFFMCVSVSSKDIVEFIFGPWSQELWFGSESVVWPFF